MKFFRITAIAALTGLFLMTGCEKDDDVDPIPTPTITGKSVELVIKPMWGDTPIQLLTDYDMDGVDINFEFLKFYISDIELIDDAGTVLADNDGIPYLASTEQTAVTIGTTTADHLHMLRFDIGLDETINHQDPIASESELFPEIMHWGWNPAGGYKFTRFDYKHNGDSFQSHCATDPLFREDVALSVHDVSTIGDDIHIEVEVDFAEIFGTTPLPNSDNHGATPYNISYIDILGSGSPFSVEL